MRRSLATLVMLVVGCSGSNNAQSNNARQDVTPLMERVATAQCSKILECCATEELQQVFGDDTTDLPDCERAIATQSSAFLQPALQRALADGTIELRESAIEACVQALDQRTCDQFEPLASADVLQLVGCTDVVVAQLTLSAFCRDDFECETGFCSHPPADAEGACKNPPQLDEPCLNDRCSKGLVCNPDSICAQKVGAGELCTRNADCKSDLCSPNNDGELACDDVAETCTGSL